MLFGEKKFHFWGKAVKNAPTNQDMMALTTELVKIIPFMLHDANITSNGTEITLSRGRAVIMFNVNELIRIGNQFTVNVIRIRKHSTKKSKDKKIHPHGNPAIHQTIPDLAEWLIDEFSERASMREAFPEYFVRD
jgi:hypothetical protein